MKDCYYYFCLAPIQPKYRDDPDTPPLVELPVTTKRGQGSVALLGVPNEVHMLRIKIPAFEEDKLSDADCDTIQILKEHAVSVMRLCYDLTIQLSSLSFFAFRDSEGPATIALDSRSELNPHWRLDGQNFKNSYLVSYKNKELIHLLSEAFDPHVPLQFRILSLYKFLEHEYKGHRSWNKGFDGLVERFQGRFSALGLSGQSLKNYIHSLRDRCAHIRGRGEMYGVTTLSNKDARELQKTLPFLIEICSSSFNERHGAEGFRIAVSPKQRTPPDANTVAPK